MAFQSFVQWLWCLTPLSTIFQLFRWSVLLVEETGVHGANHRPAASHWQTLSYNVVSSRPSPSGIRTHNVSGDMHWLPYDHDHDVIDCKCNIQVCQISEIIMQKMLQIHRKKRSKIYNIIGFSRKMRWNARVVCILRDILHRWLGKQNVSNQTNQLYTGQWSRDLMRLFDSD